MNAGAALAGSGPGMVIRNGLPLLVGTGLTTEQQGGLRCRTTERQRALRERNRGRVQIVTSDAGKGWYGDFATIATRQGAHTML